MLIMPTSYQAIRGGILLIICIKALNIEKNFMDHRIRLLFVLNFLICALNISYSIIIGNQGSLAFITVILIWPLLYMFFMIKCKSMEILYNLFKVITYGGVVVLITNALFFLNNVFLGIGVIDQLAEFLGYRYGIYEGFTEYFSASQSYLPYFLYFSVTILIVPHKKLNIRNKWFALMAILSSILILVSGRRSMWLMIGLLPIMLLFLLKISKVRGFSFFKIISISCVVTSIIGYVLIKFYDLDQVVLQLSSSFDFQYNNSNYERTLQMKSLFEDFLNNPLFGKGIGSVSSYIRTPDRPWEYELTYNYLLACFGVIGVLIMTLSYLWVIIKSIKMVRKENKYIELILPALSGMIVFLIINASNPYLLKFDFLWIFFLPIMIINQISTSKYYNIHKNK